MGRGSRSRRCSRRSSAASARCSGRCSARWWSRRSASSTKLVTGDAPGLDLVIYGGVLILVVAFAPRGIAGMLVDLRRLFRRSEASASHRSAAMAEPLLRVENVSKRFGGLLAVDRASFAAEAGRITALIGPNGAGKTTLFSIISGLPARRAEGRIHLRRQRHHRPAAAPARPARHRPHLPDRAAVRGADRAREHRGRRASVPAGARRRARRRGRGRATRSDLGELLDRPAASADRRRPQAARAGARAGDRAAAAAARRGAGRAQPVRDPRHGAGDPRHRATAASPS